MQSAKLAVALLYSCGTRATARVAPYDLCVLLRFVVRPTLSHNVRHYLFFGLIKHFFPKPIRSSRSANFNALCTRL